MNHYRFTFSFLASKRTSIFLFLAALSVVPRLLFAVSTEVNATVTCPDGICLLRGCTDPAALNYDPDAGYDDGTCQQKPPVIVDVRGCTDSSARNFNPKATVDDGSCQYDVPGCMDPVARNYNPAATVDNGSCRYLVPNVLNFRAAKTDSGIRLQWSLPSFSKLESVVIVKTIGRVPSSIQDGEVLYEGKGQSIVDPDTNPGITYHYLAVVKSQTDEYSSGSYANVRIEPEPPIEPPEGEEENDGDNGDGGRGGGSGGFWHPFKKETFGPVGPFDNLAVATSAPSFDELEKIPELFVLRQPGERVKPFFDGGYIKIKGNKPFTISVDYYKMPEVLKTIGVTFHDVDDPSRSFSFLLRLNETKTAYEATIGPLPDDGVYATSIYLINYQDQTIKKFRGQIAVVGTLGILGVGTEKFVTQVAGPVAVTGGVAAGAFQLLFASGNAVSFADIYLFALRQLGALLGLFGLKKKNKPWGTVYDSITKRPLDPAYVSVISHKEEIATAITDIDGRYGFSLLDGEYELRAAKTHYRFPSALLVGKRADEVYDNLYFGGPFRAGAGEVVSMNIPMDPVGFDWNEFVKGQGDYFKLHTRREFVRAKIVRYVYRAGLAASLFYLIFYPSILNIAVPVLYAIIHFAHRYWRKRHQTVFVKDKATGEPISFALVRVHYADLNQEVKKVVADMVGRFYLLVRPGLYYVTVDRKQADGSYVRIYQSPAVDLKKGVWENDILI